MDKKINAQAKKISRSYWGAFSYKENTVERSMRLPNIPSKTFIGEV